MLMKVKITRMVLFYFCFLCISRSSRSSTSLGCQQRTTVYNGGLGAGPWAVRLTAIGIYCWFQFHDPCSCLCASPYNISPRRSHTVHVTSRCFVFATQSYHDIPPIHLYMKIISVDFRTTVRPLQSYLNDYLCSLLLLLSSLFITYTYLR